jgi:hypothetical protein
VYLGISKDSEKCTELSVNHCDDNELMLVNWLKYLQDPQCLEYIGRDSICHWQKPHPCCLCIRLCRSIEVNSKGTVIDNFHCVNTMDMPYHGLIFNMACAEVIYSIARPHISDSTWISMTTQTWVTTESGTIDLTFLVVLSYCSSRSIMQQIICRLQTFQRSQY